jgi:glutamate racemase
VIQRELGRGVAIVGSGHAIAEEVHEELRTADLERDASAKGDYRFLATGDPDGFRRLGTRFLQLPIAEVTHVDVGPARRAAA